MITQETHKSSKSRSVDDGCSASSWKGSALAIVTELRETYADLPVVLTSVDRSPTWVETEGPHRVTPLVGDPTPAELLAAVEATLADQGMAV